MDETATDTSYPSLKDEGPFPSPGQDEYAGNCWDYSHTSALITESAEMIQLQVTGIDKPVHAVHKSLLCFYSKYYDAALNGPYAEAKKTSFTVRCSANALALFISWLYTGSLGSVEREQDPGYRYFLGSFLPLYVLADQIEVLALRRDVLTHLQLSAVEGDRSQPPMDCKVLQYTLKHLPVSSPMRDWLVDTYAHHWDSGSGGFVSDGDMRSIPADFLCQVLNGMARDKNGMMAEMSSDFTCIKPDCSCCFDICQYHEHQDEEEQEASKQL